LVEGLVSQALRTFTVNTEASIAKAARIVGAAEAIVITAGAGMGVDSGLPDFRGDKGFWKAYPVARRLGLSFTDLANPYRFEDDPRLAWAFYGHRLNLYRRIVPHDGFQRLLDLCESKPRGYFVFTSNVDEQFQRAGFDSHRIVECHGSIHRLQCVSPCTDDIWSADPIAIAIDESRFRTTGELPSCTRCGDLARPNILMFGDYAWISKETDAQRQRMNRWWNELVSLQARVSVIELGAGTAIPTVRRMSEAMAAHSSVSLIRINPRESDVPAGHISVPMGAEEGVRTMLSAAVQ